MFNSWICVSRYLTSVYFRSSTNLQGVNCASHPLDNQMFLFLKLFVLQYADDTVIVSETAEDLQNALNIYEQYCNIWKLTVNTSKTKVLIINTDRHRTCQFYYNGIALDIVNSF